MRRKWIRRLARTLASNLGGSALDQSIREQIVADAMESDPQPSTLMDLLHVIETASRPGGAVALEFVAKLRHQAGDMPNLRLDEMVD